MADPPNQLYFGDNHEVLARHIPDQSVDLVYLDPPFNSEADYNVLFEEHDGTEAAAQINAFDDTWTWDENAAAAFYQAVQSGHGRVPQAMQGFQAMLGDSDVLAYLAMMAPRLIELHRVLKPTGSIYLHCDPTASHYLKLLMDAVFGPETFGSEIIWKRTSGHSDSKRFGRVHDTILFFRKFASDALWNQLYQPYDPAYVNQYYRYQDPDGRRFQSADLGAAGLQGGGYDYQWNGITRTWRCPIQTMQRYEDEGRIYYTRNGFPRLKRYLDQARGLAMQDVWTNIEALRSWHAERLGYPTQKPEALLERIIQASSNEGDVVLDPFCGCGTAVSVAQKLGRRWIGIDITHLAVGLIKHRLFDSHGISDKQNPPAYQVIGEPTSFSGAKALANQDRFQFQAWALGLVKARVASSSKRGADKGIDGRLYFSDEQNTNIKQVVLSVKSGNISVADVRDLVGVLDREQDRGAVIGVLVTLQKPTKPMVAEAASAGMYASPWGTSHARIQTMTIEGLLKGHQHIGMPPTGDMRTFRKAPRQRPQGHNAAGDLF